MHRKLETATLDGAASYHAGLFMSNFGVRDRDWVMGQFYNFTFKDEFEYLIDKMRGQLGKDSLALFEKMGKDRFEPRDDELFRSLLSEKLAIDPEGVHLEGVIGSTQVNGTRYIRQHMIDVEALDSIRQRQRMREAGLDPGPRLTVQKIVPLYWPIYAGETEERLAGSGVADDLPEGTPGLPVGALNTNVSIAFAQAGVDAALALLDEGSVAGFINGRTGAQPVDPNAAETGTLLFSLTLTTPNPFGAAADDSPGALATAAAIADDVSADATNTLVYCRGNSSNSLFTPLAAHIDGEAGTSGADFNFNTVAIVSGATVEMTSWTVTQPQGPTAT